VVSRKSRPVRSELDRERTSKASRLAVWYWAALGFLWFLSQALASRAGGQAGNPPITLGLTRVEPGTRIGTRDFHLRPCAQVRDRNNRFLIGSDELIEGEVLLFFADELGGDQSYPSLEADFHEQL
jgi:hypothetical protein